MPTAYVVQDDGRFNLSDVRRFGEIQVVYTKEIYADNAEEMMPKVIKRAYDVLQNFKPNEDFLVLVGAPMYTAVCSYVLGDLAKTPVRLLRYDRVESSYYQVTIQ